MSAHINHVGWGRAQQNLAEFQRLKATGKSYTEVADATGYSYDYVRRLISRGEVNQSNGKRRVQLEPPTTLPSDGILPQLVIDVLGEYGQHISCNPTSCCVLESVQPKIKDIQTKYNISRDMVTGILRGRYDHIAGINRAAKKQVRIVRGRRTNDVMLYDTKGYVPSGKSIGGAVEMSDDGLYLKCHECGTWHANLALHLNQDHNMKVKQYKERHGLKMGTALINEPMRIKLAATGKAFYSNMNTKQKAEFASRLYKGKGQYGGGRGVNGGKHSLMYQNAKGICPAQTLHDLRALADRLDATPSYEQIEANGISIARINHQYGSVANALLLCDRTPNVSHRTQWYSDQELIETLKNFSKQRMRTPLASDCRRGMLPSYQTFIRRFGSWKKALKLAGLTPTRYSKKRAMATAVFAQPKVVNGYYA